MPVLPSLSGRRAVSTSVKAGWQIARQRGSDIILIKPGEIATLSVPDHKELAKGTMRALIRSSGMTTAEFVRLMD